MNTLKTKNGKQLKINLFNNYKTNYGSVNTRTPKALYINISAWVEPQKEIVLSYDRIIRDFNKKIKQTLYDYFDKDGNKIFNKDRTIVDLDIRESGVRYGKRSFVNCEITLSLINEVSILSDSMKELINNIIIMLVDGCFENNNNFKFHKRKT